MAATRRGDFYGFSKCVETKPATRNWRANMPGSMLKMLSALVIGLLLLAPLCFAQQTVPSQIKGVTLFSDQALITRETKVKVNKGLNEIFLELEVFRVDKDSISAKVFGDGEIFSVQFKEIYVKDYPQEKVQALYKEIEELKESKRVLSDKKDVLVKEEQFLKSVLDFSKTQVPQDIKTSFPRIEDLKSTLSFLASNFESINQQKQGLDSKIKEIEKQIKALESELKLITKPQKKTKKVIEVLFDSHREQEINIEASYLARHAWWKPFYKAAVPLDLAGVHLTMFSKILQKTGEDWKDIELSISNVIPLKGAALPSLASWVLDIPRPLSKAMRRKSRFALAEKAAEPSAVPADREEVYEDEAGFVQARKKKLPLSFEYKMPQSLSIQSRDKETMLPLFTKQLKGEFFYYAVPKVNPLSFMVCKTSADKELLSGPLNVYFGSRFVGKTLLSQKVAGEAFNLNLGADREVKVKREKVKDKLKETFFGKIERNRVIREIVFKITVENMKDRPIKIDVLDSIPVSRTDKIEVEDVKIKPEPTQRDHNDREGVMLWAFELQPGNKKEINLSFVVTHPRDMPLLGL